MSRHLDFMSDVENVDNLLRIFSRDGRRNNQTEEELNLDSGSSRPQQSSNLVGEDFRSLLNTNSRDNSEMTNDKTGIISEEFPNCMSRKPNEIEPSLNSQTQDASATATAEKVLPSIQNTLDMHERGNFMVVDRRSFGAANSKKTWENHFKSGFTRENQRQVSREFSRLLYKRKNCDMWSGNRINSSNCLFDFHPTELQNWGNDFSSANKLSIGELSNQWTIGGKNSNI